MYINLEFKIHAECDPSFPFICTHTVHKTIYFLTGNVVSVNSRTSTVGAFPVVSPLQASDVLAVSMLKTNRFGRSENGKVTITKKTSGTGTQRSKTLSKSQRGIMGGKRSFQCTM